MLPTLGNNVKGSFETSHNEVLATIADLKAQKVPAPVEPTEENGGLEKCNSVDPELAKRATSADIAAMREIKKMQEGQKACLRRNGKVTMAYTKEQRAWFSAET